MAPPPLKPALQKPLGYIPQQPSPARTETAVTSVQAASPLTLCCRKCYCVLCVFILILIVALIVYDPQLPIFQLQSFRVPRMNITEKLDGTYLDASTVARVEVNNPNSKIQRYFGETRLAILAADGNVNLGKKTIPRFSIKAKDVMLLKAETSVKDQILGDNEGKNLKGKFRSREFVPSVEVRTRVGEKVY